MELTQAERKRLAEEMRGLAMECLENGPAMEDKWCGCAIGLSVKRAGLWSDRTTKEELASIRLAEKLDGLLTDDDWTGGGIVSVATRDRAFRGNPTAVVFPLLALADEVEQPPAGPSSALPAVLSDSTEEEK